MLYISDTVCHLLHIEYPDWKMSFEYDPEKAIQNRKKIFREVTNENSLVFGFHLLFPSLGMIYLNESSYEWYPINTK